MAKPITSQLGRIAIVAASILMCDGAAPLFAQAPSPGRSDQRPSHQTIWSTLEKFESQEAYNRYVRAALSGGEAPAMPMLAPEFSPERASEARVSPPGSTADNGSGIDEGDIVKQVGRFLVVVHDGRLISIDLRPDGHPGLRVVDRVDILRMREEDREPHDELYMLDNRLVVTSRAQGVRYVATFALGASGALARESAHSLDWQADPYGLWEADRAWLANGRLVLHAEMSLSETGPAGRRPRQRRWLPSDRWSAGASMLSARDIYAPVQSVHRPHLHMISVCSFGGPGDAFGCKNTGVVGAPGGVLNVSQSDAYLWLAAEPVYQWTNAQAARLPECAPGAVAAFADVPAGPLIQIPLDGQEVRAVLVRGHPPNHLSFNVSDGEVRALLYWDSARCRAGRWNPRTLKYFSMPISTFQRELRTASAQHYFDVRDAGKYFASRFTGTHLLYVARGEWTSTSILEGPAIEPSRRTKIVVMPLADPGALSVLDSPFPAARIVRAGSNVVVTDFRGVREFDLALVSLAGAPRLASAAPIEGPFIGEEHVGESDWVHLPMSRSETNAAGTLLGIPTIGQGGWSPASVSPQRPRPDKARPLRPISGVVFASLGAAGISPLGILTARDRVGYRCSRYHCADPAANSRAIFADDRVFALAGAELIEGEITGGGIREVRRINLAAPRQTSAPR